LDAGVAEEGGHGDILEKVVSNDENGFVCFLESLGVISNIKFSTHGRG
jgi:hypothetical protein